MRRAIPPRPPADAGPLEVIGRGTPPNFPRWALDHWELWVGLGFGLMFGFLLVLLVLDAR